MNDKNSSTARELAILKEANYKHLEGKLNYDGFNDNEFVEVKLRNLDTSNILKILNESYTMHKMKTRKKKRKMFLVRTLSRSHTHLVL